MSAETAAPAPAEAQKPKTAGPPQKPDEATFKAAEAQKQKELKAVQAKLAEVRSQLDNTKPNNRDPRSLELRSEQQKIRSQVSTKKTALSKLNDQIRTLQDSITSRGRDLTTKQKALPFRTLSDLERRITDLDSQVSTGRMKIVDEKKALQEISNLNKAKKQFAAIEEAQKSIDADKLKLKELKDKKTDPELVELNKQYDTIQKELDELRAVADAARKNVDGMRDERNRLQKEQNRLYDELKAVKDEYYKGIREWRDHAAKVKKAREERWKKEKEERDLAYKKQRAEEKLEEASRPAFASEIITCESLIGYFDPSSAEALKKAKQTVASSELKAKAARTVDNNAPTKGKVLVKEEEEYFVGTAKKSKGKKGKKNAKVNILGEDSTVADIPEEAAKKDEKLSLNLGLLEELAKVGVKTPSSVKEVPETIEALREKLKWYRENEDKVTKENIEKAKKEIAKLDKDEKEAESPAAETPVATEEKVEEEKKEEPVTAAAAEEKDEEKAEEKEKEEEAKE